METEDRKSAATAPASWWRDGVLYQIYPRSFADSDGDGVGDLQGVISRLDHLEWLGVAGIWLNPITPSPNADWGYDVADFCDVDPALGTLADLDELVAAAGECGIRVILDLVPNHTSAEHPWFQDALRGRDARRRDFYVWADPDPRGGPPNNWASTFGGSAWTPDEASGQLYLHSFLPEQPDLNWHNEEVRAAFDEILRFWFDRGVAGFRIDVAHALVHDALLRDDPPAEPHDPPGVRRRGYRYVFSMNRPEVHDVYRRWRKLTRGYRDEPILLGETYVLDLEDLFRFYGEGEDQLHLAFNFLFVHAELEAEALRTVVEGVEAGLPERAWPVYTGSNHDAGRLVRRWAGGDEAKARVALLMLLTLRGTPVLYYGDEIAMPEPELDPAAALDPVPRRTGDPARNRDPGRTPMQWSSAPGAGFTTAADPWLPLGDAAAHNVAAQRDDPGSTLHLVRDLVARRRDHADLRGGAYSTLPAPAGAWAWRRGEEHATALNMSDREVGVDGLDGTIAIATDRTRDGERVAGRLRLGPWQGALVALEAR